VQAAETRGPVLVPTTPEDRYFDYCLQAYEPRCSPVGKLRGESLLWHSFEVAGASETVRAATRGLQAHAGRDATVWGVKHAAGALWWELYFYDPQKEDPRVTVGSVTQALEPWLHLAPRMRESVPYFMFSFDLRPEWGAGHAVDALNVYLAEPVGQAGRSYVLRESGLELDNLYHFFHPKLEIREVLARIRSSTFVDFSAIDVGRVLLPELLSCRRICVAKKRRSDAVYYSGIDVDQLLWFLRRFHHPASIVDFVAGHRSRLDHLRFDVGIDYTAGRDGIEVAKTGFYSTV
jgi:hypothetical protein